MIKKSLFIISIMIISISISAQHLKDFNPSNYLDGSVEVNTMPVKIEASTQLSGIFSGTLKDLVEAFKNTFANDQIAQSDFDWLLNDLWPQATEIAIQDQSYNENIYSNVSQVGYTNFVIDEYGSVVPSNSYSNNQEFSSPIVTAGNFPNRSYGFKRPNFDYSISLTTNGRKYTINWTAPRISSEPIVLDLDGDGKLEASNGIWLTHPYKGGKMVEFDMNGDGFIELTEWVGPNDGLLIIYKNKSDVSCNDLFGDSDGFIDGFEKLSTLDSNRDGKISGKELDILSVWQDKNGNAKIDKEEVKSVKEMGITLINLNHKRFVSTFIQNGVRKKCWNWHPVVIDVKKERK